MRAKVKAGDSDSAAFCNRLSDLVILAAGFGVDRDSLARRHVLQCEGIIGARAILCGGKLDGHRLRLGELGGLEHLPFINADTAPRGSSIIINAQSPFLCSHRFVQQDIRYSGGVVLDALCLYPPARRILILQSKVDGVHQHILATVLGMFYAPAADRHLTTNVNVHISGLCIGNTPFGTIQGGPVNGLGGRLALILARISGYRRPQADVFEFFWFVDFRVLIAIQPVDYQFGAFTAYTVGINGDDFQRHVVFVKITNQGRQVEGRVGGLHDQIRSPVRVDLVDLIGSSAVHSIPVNTCFRIIGVVIQDLVQRHRSRTGQRRAILIQNGKLAQVDAVVGHSSIAFHL